MRTIEQKINDLVELVKSDEKNYAYFISSNKDVKLFPYLADVSFFRFMKSGELDSVELFVLNYFEIISDEIKNNNIKDSGYINKFLQTLRLINSLEGHFLYSRIIFLIYSKIPLDYLSEKDILKMFSFIKDIDRNDSIIDNAVLDAFESLISNFNDTFEHRNLTNIFILQMFEYSLKVNEYSSDAELIYFGDYSFKELKKRFLQKDHSHKKAISELVINCIKTLLNQLLELPNFDSSSIYTRPAIEPHEQNNYHDSALSFYCEILFLLGSYFLSHNYKLQSIIELKDSSTITFKRIYISLATNYPNVIEPNEVAGLIYEKIGLNSSYRYEIFHFYKRSIKRLSEENIKNFVKMIDAIKVKYEENDEKDEYYSAWERLRWLMSVKDNLTPELKKSLELVQIHTGDTLPDHPDFGTYMSSGWSSGERSPYTLEDLSKMEPPQILKELVTFTSTGKFRDPTIEGFSATFEEYVIKEPIKSVFFITHLSTLNYIHISSILDGYTKLWSEKKFVPLKEIFDAISTLLTNSNFRNDCLSFDDKSSWTSNSICRFITNGTNNDENCFPENFNVSIKTILKQLIEIIPPNDKFIITSDSFTRAINEPRGKVFEALIITYLRFARLINDPKSDDFTLNSEDFYSAITPALSSFDENESSIRALIGAYHRQLIYLSEDAFFSRLDLIIPPKNKSERLWLSFMEGYCFVNIFNEKLYSFLNNRGDLITFLHYDYLENDLNNRSEKLKKRVIEFSIISLVLKKESFESSLLKRIIDNVNPSDWSNILFAAGPIIGKKSPAEDLLVASEVINYMLNIYDKNRSHMIKKGYFKNSYRTIRLFLPNNEIMQRLIITVGENIENIWEMNEVIEYLFKHKNEFPKIVGHLFYSFLKSSGLQPTYPMEKVASIVEALKKADDLETAHNICNLYFDNLCFPAELKKIYDS